MRLMEAALKLMADKGMEGVAINEITEAADVGFGSFYNHFESKEAIHLALSDWVFEEFADRLDRIAAELSDPAEVISVSIRHALLRAKHEPVWGQFLIREGLSPRALSRGLGPRLLRDLQRGIAAGRFIADDPLMNVVTIGGAVLMSIAIELRSGEIGTPIAGMLGDDMSGIGERAAAAMLQTLGLPRAEAVEIANRRLPADDAPAQAPA